jgi:hypothetical protein
LPAILCCPKAAAPEAAPGHPFAAGERFAYRVSWLGIHAATAVMEVGETPPLSGRRTLRLHTTAVSSPAVTKFYPVDNRVESFVDAETLVPQRLLFRRREGKRKNDYDISFQHTEGKVAGTKDGEAYTLPIPAGTQDSISCLYAIRNVPSLQPGFTQVMNVHHDRKNYRLEVRVEAIEKVRGSWGEVEAIRALAIMPFQGIFLNQGNIRVWFTNDARRIPVRMKARVIIGSIVADLVEGWAAPKAP